MSTTIVRGRWVFTGDDVIERGAVVVEHDRIVATGDADALSKRYPDADTLGSGHTAVLPGFVNAHHHSHGASSIQLGHSDQLLEPWILGFAGVRSGDRYLDTLLSASRLLRSGVTSVVDVHSGKGTADDYVRDIDDALRAYEQTGLRVAFATGTATQSHLVHGKGEDRRFIDQLPVELRERAEALLPRADRLRGDEFLDIVESRVRQYQPHARIDVWFAPPGPQWVSDDLMQRIAESARALDTGIQTHCNESYYEKLHGDRFYGRATVEHLEHLGVLEPRFSIAHGTWLTEREIDVLARTGTAVSHNPGSNLRLRAGIAPLNALLEAGVTVALGMDGTTLDEDDDMFAELRLALRLNRTPRLSEPVPGLEQLFRTTTQGGARLMRKASRIGRLVEGYAADLLVLNLERVIYPWVAPEADPLELVLLRARSSDVELVMVDGKVVMREGRALGFDEAEIARQAAEHLAAQTWPENQARLVSALTPHLERWYRDWETPESPPYTAYNSRL